MALDNPSPYTAQILAELETQNLVNYHNVVPNALFRMHLREKLGIASISELAANTSTLLFSEIGLTDVTGIEYMLNTTGFHLYLNDLTTVNITELTNATYINLTSTNLDTLPNVSGLLELGYFDCHLNNLTSMEGLHALKKMTDFYISNNNFAQAELESVIDTLYENRIELGALSCDIRLQNNPGSTLASASRASEIADLIAAGCTVTI